MPKCWSSTWPPDPPCSPQPQQELHHGKDSTLHYLFTLAMRHGGLWVGAGMMPANTRAARRNDVNHVGSSSGAMARSPFDSSPDQMLPGDLETARQFGQRIANATVRVRG